MMRLLFVSRSLPFHHLGGMEAVAWDLAQSLAKAGHEVEILTTPCNALPRDSIKRGVRIRIVDAPAGRYSRAYWRQTAALFQGDYRHRVDLVLGIGGGAYSIARVRKPGDRPPIIMQTHGQAWGEMMSALLVPNPISWIKAPKNAYGVLIDRVLRRFDHIIAVGPAVEKILRSSPTRWMVGGTPISVIPNGIDEERFAFEPAGRAELRAQLSLDPSDQVLISASRLHVQKGLKEGLEGFARARREISGLRYIVAGSGPAEGLLRDHARRLGVARDIRFVGAINRDDLPGLLCCADLFLLTSLRREGLALGPLEAAATGLPTILSHHLAVPGLVSTLVDPRQSQRVAGAIVASVQTIPSQRRSFLPEEYSLRVATKRYQQLFATALR